MVGDNYSYHPRPQSGCSYIYISPKLANSLVNYIAVSDRIIGASFLTKDDVLVILNQHAPEEKTPKEEKNKFLCATALFFNNFYLLVIYVA